jgi:uncharacterized SAM-binding protein YcdF (DUF218 family)
MSPYQVLHYLLQPFVFLYLCLGLSIAWVWWRQPPARRGLRLVILVYLVIPALATSVAHYFVLGSLERMYPPLDRRPADIQAIVVLSGDHLQPDSVRTSPEAGPASMYRCLRAAELYHDGPPCPVVVSGGLSAPNPVDVPCAQVMRDLLLRLGVKSSDLVVEDGSSDTHENAIAAAKILKEKKLARVLLVTDAAHLPRAVACFREQGIEVVPAGCRYRGTEIQPRLQSVLPATGEAQGVERAVREWLGLAWYKIRGWI